MPILEMSLSGTALVLFTLLMRATVFRRTSRRIVTAAWALIALRMLLPFSLPLGAWMVDIGLVSRPVVVNYINAQTMLPTGGGMSMSEFILPSIADLAGMLAISASNRFSSIQMTGLYAVWLVAAILIGARTIRDFLRCRRALSAAVPIEGMALPSATRRRPVPVYRSRAISTPLAVGVIRPRILLPADMELSDARTLSFVFCHELKHIDHFDIITKNLCLIAACVHWFNPLAWVLLALARFDIELACDADVLSAAGGVDACRDYAMALIGLEERRSKRHARLATPFSANAAERRIRSVMGYRRLKPIRPLAALAIALFVLAAFTTTTNIPAVVRDELVSDDLGEAEFIASFPFEAPCDIAFENHVDAAVEQALRYRAEYAANYPYPAG